MYIMLYGSKEVVCARCNGHCYGDVVNAYDQYYHQKCFSCKVVGCKNNLIQDGYFSVDGEFYCREDYHKVQGLMCARCNSYVEGLAVSAINSFYHPTCFSCFHCNDVFVPNTAICYDGQRISCENCSAMVSIESMENLNAFDSGRDRVKLPKNKSDDADSAVTFPAVHSTNYDVSTSKCASCGGKIGECQSLMALEKAWHLRCFTCSKCGKLLAEEYIGKNGIPYCEEDYQTEFGVSCAGCKGYITGKVLQAGGKHYHPSCSRCGKCDELFGEGEEMYLRGSEIWHPSCSEETEVEEEQSNTTRGDIEVENVTMNNGLSNSLNSNGTETSSQRKHITSEQYQENNFSVRTNSVSNGDFCSTDHKVNIWKPPPYRTSLSTSLGQADGFYSIKPSAESFTSTSQAEEEEEEDIPPVPPPPKRSSSNSWRLKYSTGVYTPTPFQKMATRNIKPISRNSPNDIEREECNELLSINIQNQMMNDDEENLDGVSPNTAALIQKGIGFNKLQYRRSLRENQRKTENN